MVCGIYMICNKGSGKIYIGSSSDIDKRWVQHRIQLAQGNHHNPALQDDWLKYGGDAFEFDVLEQCEDIELRWKELQAIELYSFIYRLYNVPSRKNDIVYKVCSHLENVGADFLIDKKIKINGKRYNFNIYCLVNWQEIYINLRDDRFDDQKAAESFALKAEHVASNGGYLTEFNYNPDLNDEEIQEIIDNALDYIDMVGGLNES